MWDLWIPHSEEEALLGVIGMIAVIGGIVLWTALSPPLKTPLPPPRRKRP